MSESKEKKTLVKRNIVYTVGSMEFDAEKNRYTGFVNGQYATLTKSKDEKWYLNLSLNATVFESNIPKMDAQSPL